MTRVRFDPHAAFVALAAFTLSVVASLAGCTTVTPSQGSIWGTPEAVPQARRTSLPPLSGKPIPSEDEDQIRILVQRMQLAIGDHSFPEYLSCLAPTDVATRAEQVYFANDLSVKPVRSVTLLVESLVAGPSDDIAHGSMRWLWRYADAAQAPRREFESYVRFRRTDAGWLYDGPLWERLVDHDAQVWYLRGYEPAAKAAMSAFRAVKSSVEATLRAHPTGPHIIKLYRSPQELKFSISLSYNDDIDGWNEPGESIRVVTAKDKPESEFRSLIAHEYGHVCTFALGPTANDMPWWTLEGMAELAAEPFAKDGIEHVRSLRKESAKGTLVPLADLASMDTIRPENFGKVYSQGRGVVRHVLTTYGPDKLDAWLRAMANGMPYPTSCSSILGVTDTELERRWRDSLQ
jgi:hypothetical protein